MANTASVYIRINSNLKNEVDGILKELGVTPSTLIQMLYKQILIQKRIPFEVKLPTRSIFIEDYTKEELESQIEESIKQCEEGKCHTADEVDEILKNKYGF